MKSTVRIGDVFIHDTYFSWSVTPALIAAIAIATIVILAIAIYLVARRKRSP